MIRRRPERVALACGALLLALAVAPANAQTYRHAPGWSKAEAERFTGARVRAQKSLTSWGPVILRGRSDETVQPKRVGRPVLAGAEGKIIGAERNELGSWSVVVEWGAPEFSAVYKKPVVWRTAIDRVHYASAVVEISRPTTPPVKPGRH